MPMRKRSCEMKSVRHRFLWMVVRSLCTAFTQQKVEIHRAKHTREITMPTQETTNRMRACMPPVY